MASTRCHFASKDFSTNGGCLSSRGGRPNMCLCWTLAKTLPISGASSWRCMGIRSSTSWKSIVRAARAAAATRLPSKRREIDDMTAIWRVLRP